MQGRRKSIRNRRSPPPFVGGLSRSITYPRRVVPLRAVSLVDTTYFPASENATKDLPATGQTLLSVDNTCFIVHYADQ